MEQLLKQAEAAGLAVKKISLSATASEDEIKATLERLSADRDVAGIILQSPLPDGVSRTRVVTAISPEKDIDGITESNAARLSAGELDGTLLPATAAAVMELLRAHQIEPRGQRAVVVGRSAVVGRPVAQLLALAGAAVEVVHSKTPDMGAITRTAQILVVAAGVRGLVRGEHVAQGCVVVDVGIHADGDQIVGDVDAASVSAAIGESGALSPVRGSDDERDPRAAGGAGGSSRCRGVDFRPWPSHLTWRSRAALRRSRSRLLQPSSVSRQTKWSRTVAARRRSRSKRSNGWRSAARAASTWW
jgi:methylenetetrahydrofolate dehydrogenase (NADP+)/methenyltetrahydrofolate cyclohydrolase